MLAPVSDQLITKREPAATSSLLGRLIARLSRRREYAYILMPLLLAAAFASLILLNILVRDLRGQLVYGVAVTAIGFWALAQTKPVRDLLESWGDPGFSFRRAVVWSTFAIVALPVAVAHPQPSRALAALLLVPIVWAMYRLVRRLGRRWFGPPARKRAAWGSVALGIAFLLIFVYRTKPAELVETTSGSPPPPAAESRVNARLAARVRPLLVFDRSESRAPVDIEEAVRAGRVHNCEDDDCGQRIRDVTSIDLGADYLTVEDVADVAGASGQSAYYYRVVPGEDLVYVDFWWYFTRNPSPIGASLGCGPAARWVKLTCHEHPSDWEGVTVVLGDCGDQAEHCITWNARELAPAAVRYAQHEHIVSYSWRTLLQLWEGRDRLGGRPLVFVARDSHASYPSPCLSGCKQIAAYPLSRGRWKRDESRHDGGEEWAGNGENCEPKGQQRRSLRTLSDCLLAMPITEKDSPASWNAFPGRWGSQKCILDGAYCDTSKAPKSPSQQPRYQDPSRPGIWRCVKEGRHRRMPPPLETCADEVDPDDDIPT